LAERAGPGQVVATAYAYYVQYLRYVAAGFTVGARYDDFDPDIHDQVRVQDDGSQRTIGLLAMRGMGENIRLSLAWELPRVTVYDKTSQAVSHLEDEVWTLQGLYRF
jgi:hypothetical protein